MEVLTPNEEWVYAQGKELTKCFKSPESECGSDSEVANAWARYNAADVATHYSESDMPSG